MAIIASPTEKGRTEVSRPYVFPSRGKTYWTYQSQKLLLYQPNTFKIIAATAKIHFIFFLISFSPFVQFFLVLFANYFYKIFFYLVQLYKITILEFHYFHNIPNTKR